MKTAASFHHVGSLRCRLRTTHALAAPLQQRCSVLVTQQLQAQISDVLDRFGQHLRGPLMIDRLVMDIGTIALQDFEAQFSQRVIVQLERQLRHLLDGAPSTRRGEILACIDGEFHVQQAPRDADARDTPASPQNAPVRIVPRQQDAAVQLEHYLLTGDWPQPALWQTAQLRDAWIMRHWSEAPRRWRAALARCCLQEQPVQRLLQTFSGKALDFIAEQLAGAGAAAPRTGSPTPPPADRLQAGALAYLQRQKEAAAPRQNGSQDAAGMRNWPPAALRAALQKMLPRTASATADTAAPVLAPVTATMPAAATIEVNNAGAVLLWPLLPGLFTQLGLVQRQDSAGVARYTFADRQAQHTAACWLDAVIWDDGAAAEWRAPLNKLLCGLPLDYPLLPWHAPHARAAAALRDWLASLPEQLPGLQACSANDLRQLFLQRPGHLVKVENHWELQVQDDASDLLLKEMPWPMQQLVLPWLDAPLPVHWLHQ